MTDEQIIHGCLHNDLRTQKYLYERYAPRMMGVCLRYTDNSDEAKDLLQDGFIKVFQHISSFKFTGQLEGWVKTVIINNALEQIRKKKIVFERLDDDYSENDHLHPTDLQHDVKDLLRMLQNLPSGYRTIFNLYAIEGYNHKEIAERLEISEGTSKSQYARARVYIQKMLSPELSKKKFEKEKTEV
jgi:RNA polymerase sigma-70 factor (ECF subfamily)